MQLHQASALCPDADRALAERLEATHAWSIRQYAAALTRHHPEVGADWLEIAGGNAIYTGQSPFTLAIGVSLRVAIDSYDLDRIERFFGRHGVKPAIDICPYSHPSLGEQLAARGYRPREVSSVLCCDLTNGTTDLQPPSSEISVRWVESQDLEAWTDLLAQSFFASEPSPLERANLGAMFQLPDSLHALAFLDGELAGAAGGILPPPGGIAIVFGACTYPRFRLRGVHTALMQFRLERIRQHGCKLVLATAIPGSDSERNLQRHGFRAMYEKQTWEKR